MASEILLREEIFLPLITAIRTGNSGNTHGVRANKIPARKNPLIVNSGEAIEKIGEALVDKLTAQAVLIVKIASDSPHKILNLVFSNDNEFPQKNNPLCIIADYIIGLKKFLIID